MAAAPAKSFPRVLLPAWHAADPASERLYPCDALALDTPQRKLTTRGGDYWLCSHTGQMVRDVFPEMVPERYDRWWREQIGKSNQAKEIDRYQRMLLSYQKYRKLSTLLEVGSGEGLLLKAAAELGWQAQGNEVSPYAAAHAQKITSCPVYPGPIEQVELPESAYDVVLCKDVFEHLTQPRLVLAKLAAALRPGGVLFLQTLSGQSLSLYVQPVGWEYFGPGHTFVPTRASLECYFQGVGLDLVHCQTHGFRSAGRDKRDASSYLRRRLDRLAASAAGLLGLGHRIECLLQKPAAG